MEMNGYQMVPLPQRETWDALNDTEVLKECIPGCETIERLSDTQYQVIMKTRIGPVSARFKGLMTLTDMAPPKAYTMTFEGQGGVAGFAKGQAKVDLQPEGDATRLGYAVTAKIGGKLAQLGARLIDGVARKLADDFFPRSTRASAPGAAMQPLKVSRLAATFFVALPATFTAATAAENLLPLILPNRSA